MEAYRLCPSSDKSADILEQIAIAVAAPESDVLLIGPDNEQVGSSSIHDAIWSERCGAIIVGDQFLALDADANTKPESPSYVSQLHYRLAQGNFRPVMAESGRVGHLHLWCRIADWFFLRGLECEARQHGCDVRRGLRLRPPGSCHRLGLPVALVGMTLEQALDALNASGPVVALTPRTERLIRFGDTSGRYATHSESFWACVLGAVAKGADGEWLRIVMFDPSNAGGQRLDNIIAKKNRRAAERYVAAEYKRARKVIGDQSAKQVRADVLAKLALIERMVDIFPDLTPAYRAVWQARIECSREAGSMTHRVGKRAVARRAGVASTSTVKLADVMLVSIGAMVAHARGRETSISEFELILPRIAPLRGDQDRTDILLPSGVNTCSITIPSPALDTWRAGALGKAAWRVCRSLARVGPMTAVALAKRLGYADARSLRVHLRALAKEGIVAADADRRWSFVASEDVLAACALGASGVGERQLERDLSDAADDRLRKAMKAAARR
jgi:hypothetical protein